MARGILVVDDDRTLADVLALALQDAGFEAMLAHDGETGLAAALERRPALILLDVGLPKLDGFAVCRELRARGCGTPVILLTSRAEEIDKILGLELGADDYVTKPFSTRELIARIRAALRRVEMVATGQVRANGALQLDRGKRLASYAGVELTLTSTEFELLWALCCAGGNVCTREALIVAAYGPRVVVADRTIDTFVKRIRAKLVAADPTFGAVQTVRGVGYRYR